MDKNEQKRWRRYVRQRVKVNPKTRCWAWQLHLAPNGYGFTHAAHGCGRYAHRLAFVAFKGPIPEGFQVRHQCHNRACCNPAHLLVGTDQENKDDTMRDGRAWAGQVLTPAKVRVIKRLLARGKHTKAAIGRRFGVSDVSICNINSGKTWRNL